MTGEAPMHDQYSKAHKLLIPVLWPPRGGHDRTAFRHFRAAGTAGGLPRLARDRGSGRLCRGAPPVLQFPAAGRLRHHFAVSFTRQRIQTEADRRTLQASFNRMHPHAYRSPRRARRHQRCGARHRRRQPGAVGAHRTTSGQTAAHCGHRTTTGAGGAPDGRRCARRH